MKKCIMVGYEEEKLLALRMYAEQKGVSIEDELEKTAESLYRKIVPGNVKDFLKMRAGGQKPKKSRGISSSAVGVGSSE